MRCIFPLMIMLLSLLLSACEGQAPQNTTTIRVDQAMGGQPDPAFARALEPRAFQFPQDHGAHPEFATEWWYLTGNLRSENGQRFGYQLTLFRVGLRPGQVQQDSSWRTNQVYMGHLAISDIAAARHYSTERFARAAAGLAGARLEPFEVWLGPWSMRADRKQSSFIVSAEQDDIGISLQLLPGNKRMILQGERGLSRKSATPGNASFYYSFTRLPTRGEIRVGDKFYTVEGNSWLDREWSSSALDKDQAGWDWFALQLDDGREVMYYQMRNKQGGAHAFSSGKLVEKDGRVHTLLPNQMMLMPSRYWQARDGERYPVKWSMQIAEHQLDLEVEAMIDDQLMDHTVRYWEGAVGVSGSHTGKGYLELSGYDSRE